MKTMGELLSAVKTLPTLPDVVLRVMRASNDPSATVDDIVEILKLDQGVTVSILRLCNSPFYGVARKIDSIHEAVVYLGSKSIVDLLMANFCSQFFRRPLEAYRLEEGQLWQHAVAVAIASQVISEQTTANVKSREGLGYTAGLIHDVGKIIISNHCHEDFLRIIQVTESEQIAFETAEHDVLGFSHCEIGAEVARAWRLPDGIVDAIAHHHDPTKATDNPWLVSCVHVANLLCLTMGIGLGVDGLFAQFHPEALEALGLDMPRVMAIQIDVLEKYSAALDLIATP